MTVFASARAFTLIEVLVSLAIVSLALLALSQAGGRSLDSQFQIEQRTVALWVASNVLAEVSLEGSVQAGNRSGSSNMADQLWRWQLQTQTAPGGQLWRLDVRVFNEQDQLVLTHSGFLAR